MTDGGHDSDTAFRMALEARLLERARTANRANPTLDRKLLVFERFLARLLVVAPGQWVLKGGVALEFRFPGVARMTRDLDLGWLSDEHAATRAVMAAADLDLGDRLRFVPSRVGEHDRDDGPRVAEFRCVASMAGRRFETVRIDVGLGDPLQRPPALLTGTGILEFAGIAPVAIPVLPIEQHVAEKVHAWTLPLGVGRDNTRLKDLIDLALIAVTFPLDAAGLRASLEGIFESRATHAMPAMVPAPPGTWSRRWREEAPLVGLGQDIGAGLALIDRMLDPVLNGSVRQGTWNPMAQKWAPDTH